MQNTHTTVGLKSFSINKNIIIQLEGEIYGIMLSEMIKMQFK